MQRYFQFTMHSRLFDYIKMKIIPNFRPLHFSPIWRVRILEMENCMMKFENLNLILNLFSYIFHAKKWNSKMMPGFYSSKIDKMKGLYLKKENLREPNVKWLVFRKVSRHQNCWNFGWPVMAIKMTAFCHFMRWNGAF